MLALSQYTFKVIKLQNSKAYIYRKQDVCIAIVSNQYYRLYNGEVIKLDLDTAMMLIERAEMSFN